MTSLGKVKLQVWLLIALVFVLGGVTGVSLDRLVLLRNDQARSSSAGPGGPNRRGPNRMVERMKSDLSLSDDQVTRIKSIFDESRKEFHPRQFVECPGYKEAREKTRARVREVLSPEQQKRYDEINAKRDAEFKQQFQ